MAAFHSGSNSMLSLTRSLLVSALACFTFTDSVHAQSRPDFPSKPIRLIVPFAPGGSTDILARILSKTMFPQAGQTVLVENVAGAGGNIGAALVAKAAPDGHTLEIGSMSTHAMNGSLYRQMPFDPVRDFDTVALLAYVINVIAVHPSVPANTFAELLSHIRANPGKLAYASGGIGSHNHLTLALLAKTATLDILHVPYKGGGPAVTALLQGETQMFAGGASLLLPHARAGKVRLIAVTEATRSALLPEVPSVAESIPGFEVTNWYGVFAPRGLPAAVLKALNDEINRVATQPDIAQRFRDMGMVRTSPTPAQLSATLQKDHALWTATVRALGIVPE
jgi:tripartite-type tricarboxylate transporter receptor subunit TctC